MHSKGTSGYVKEGNPQITVLGVVLFSISTDNLANKTEVTVTQLVSNISLEKNPWN